MKNQKYKHKKSIENKKENGQQKLSVRVYFCVFLNMALHCILSTELTKPHSFRLFF